MDIDLNFTGLDFKNFNAVTVLLKPDGKNFKITGKITDITTDAKHLIIKMENKYSVFDIKEVIGVTLKQEFITPN